MKARPLILLAAALVAALLAYQTVKSHCDKSNEVLASAGDRRLFRSGLGTQTTLQLEGYELHRFSLLQSAAKTWLEETLLAQEAKSQGIPVRDLIQKNIAYAPVTDEEVMKRYAALPALGSMPFEEAIAALRQTMTRDRAETAKKIYLEPLYAKYGARLHLTPPSGYENFLNRPSVNDGAPYVIPPAKPELDGGRVVSPASKGPANAPVLLEIFSDFMCPYSGRFKATADQIEKEFGNVVRIQYRHLPLSFHATADRQAEASVCAQEQGKFWPFHDALFAAQGQKNDDFLKGVASATGLDIAQFSECLSSSRYKETVARDMAEAGTRGASGTPSFFLNGRMSSGALPYESVKPAIEWLLNPRGPYPLAPQPAQNAQAAAPAPAEDKREYTFSADELTGRPTLGPAKAPVHLVEYIDFNCGYCKKADETVGRLLQQYPKDIRLTSLQYSRSPLGAEPSAAEAALCANDQGKYPEYKTLLFGEFWGKRAAADLFAAAERAKLKAGDFKACLDSKKYRSLIEADTKGATEKGVPGTPTFFVNGKKIIGAQPYETFDAAVAEALKKKKD